MIKREGFLQLAFPWVLSCWYLSLSWTGIAAFKSLFRDTGSPKQAGVPGPLFYRGVSELPLITLPDSELLKRDSSADELCYCWSVTRRMSQVLWFCLGQGLFSLSNTYLYDFPPNAKHSKVSGNVHFACQDRSQAESWRGAVWSSSLLLESECLFWDRLNICLYRFLLVHGPTTALSEAPALPRTKERE